MAVTQNRAKGYITITDLNDGATLNFGISANGATTQIYNPDSGVYNKDFTTNNLVLTPFLYVTGESNDMMSQVTNVSWTVNGGSATTWGSVGQSSPYALTINHNLTGNTTSLHCVVTGTYTDPHTNVTTGIKTELTITRLDTAGSTLVCLLTYPTGTYFYNATIASVQITATMYCGTTEDTTNVSYEWYQLISGTWTKLTSSNHGTIAGYTGRTITIYQDDVLNFEQFKCIVKDTDTTSGTYNKTAEAISQIITDLSDQYAVEIYNPSGPILTKGATSTTLTANITQNGLAIAENNTLYNSVTFTWSKYDKTGTFVSNWGTSGHKTGRTITVTRDEIDIKGTFVVEVTF